ncbi:ferritin-like domain-containing protein [Streptomyces sp. 5-8]|uniref:Ferritin-like domain-containing protein n=1 Tax=Streptomyces musisoli TaxID=2802280 RepID=A0ABS1P5K3_9ACTN|nr:MULTISPECIES: ferritin-like domain-containing protein [Streptomyces]MBL1107626.1 ferritin-like domain-containing protein [Streptomyces musisoli]MBY8842706.1 ferritin-like domain-containing protein [Streptomyces sp. SP2-10]
MVSAKSLFREILDDDESFRLFCSIAAGGEAQGGWENGRIAALVPQSERALAPKIARHGADEDKHGRIFTALLRKRGLTPVPVPPETDYTMLLERQGIGLAHDRLRRDEPLTVRDIIVYLAHSRVTEQRAADQMAMLRRHLGDHPDIGRAVRLIADDEDRHLAYTHEELLRFAAAGHGRLIQRTLRAYALAEIRVHRDVSLAVMARMGRILGWSGARSALLTAGIHAAYAYERLAGWHRMACLAMPAHRDALGDPAAPAPEYV